MLFIAKDINAKETESVRTCIIFYLTQINNNNLLIYVICSFHKLILHRESIRRNHNIIIDSSTKLIDLFNLISSESMRLL
jgi:hypothetical protein